MSENNTIKFSLFADLHYKKGMYIASIEDMNEILDRANANGADFVLHVGDFCNDYAKSPELMKALTEAIFGEIPFLGKAPVDLVPKLTL